MSRQLRAVEQIDIPPEVDFVPHAEWCLENDEPFRVGDLLLVPDLLVVLAAAHGEELPETMRLQRDDGRSVSVFYVIDGLGYGLRPLEDG